MSQHTYPISVITEISRQCRTSQQPEQKRLYYEVLGPHVLNLCCRAIEEKGGIWHPEYEEAMAQYLRPQLSTFIVPDELDDWVTTLAEAIS